MSSFTTSAVAGAASTLFTIWWLSFVFRLFLWMNFWHRRSHWCVNSLLSILAVIHTTNWLRILLKWLFLRYVMMQSLVSNGVNAFSSGILDAVIILYNLRSVALKVATHVSLWHHLVVEPIRLWLHVMMIINIVLIEVLINWNLVILIRLLILLIWWRTIFFSAFFLLLYFFVKLFGISLFHFNLVMVIENQR